MIPGFEITGTNITDAGMTVNFGVNLSSAPPSPLSYEWFAMGKVSYSETFSTTFDRIGNYTVTLTVSMSNSHTKVTKQVDERVNSDPSAYITENRSVIDVGQSISFFSSVRGGTAPYSYAWSFGSSKANPVFQFNSQIAPPPPGYSGEVQLAVQDTAKFVVFSNSLYPEINYKPFVQTIVNSSWTDIGAPVSFSADPSGGTSPYSYSWTWDGQRISTSENFSYSFSKAGEQSVYLNLTDHVGLNASSLVNVEVESDPTVSLSTSQQNAPAGTTIYFTANVSGGVSPYSYEWFINGSLVSTSWSTLYYVFNGAANYAISVVYMDQAGQTATSEMTETIT